MISVAPNKVKKFFETAPKKSGITASRKEVLNQFIQKILDTKRTEQDSIHLNFICTHNSRRSQLAQVWAFYASHYFDLPFISSFSGGTEVTAFYKNTVKTLQEAGFIFQIFEYSHSNPVYHIFFDKKGPSIKGFSKLYDHTLNSRPFIAITTCDSADENCPFIPDALARLHLPYTDPKGSDGTPQEMESYLQTNQQIASEIYYVFSEIRKSMD